MEAIKRLLGFETDDSKVNLETLLKRSDFHEVHLNDDASIVWFANLITSQLIMDHPLYYPYGQGQTYKIYGPEQFIQAKKALYLENEQEAKNIMFHRSNDVDTYIKLGAKIRSPSGRKVFDSEEWNPQGARAFAEFFKLILEDKTHYLNNRVKRILAFCHFKKPLHHIVDMNCKLPWSIHYTKDNHMDNGIKLHEGAKGVNLFGRALREMLGELADMGLIHERDSEDTPAPTTISSSPSNLNQRSRSDSMDEDKENTPPPKYSKYDDTSSLPRIYVYSLGIDSVQYIEKIRKEVTSNAQGSSSNMVPVIIELECPEAPASREEDKENDNNHVIGVQLVDESGSMSGFLDNTRKAVAQIVEDTKVGDGIGICGFSSSVRTIMECRIKPKEGFNYNATSVIASGGTNMGDGLVAALNMCHRTQQTFPSIKKKMIILLTDGESNEGVASRSKGKIAGELLMNHCRMHWKETLKMDPETIPVIHTIGFGNGYDQDVLYTLAGNQGVTHHIKDNISELSSVTKTIFGLQANVMANRVRIPVANMNAGGLDSSNSPLIAFNPIDKVISLPNLEYGRKVSFNFMIRPEYISELQMMKFTLMDSGEEKEVPVIHKMMTSHSPEQKNMVTRVINDMVDSYADLSITECSNNGNTSLIQECLKKLDILNIMTSNAPSHLKDNNVNSRIQGRRNELDSISRVDNTNDRIGVSKIRRQDIRQSKEGRNSDNSWW